MFTVYILRTSKNTLYTGYTDNLEKRMAKHQSGKGSKYMRSFESFELVYRENFETKSEAMKREAAIKLLKKTDKELLVAYYFFGEADEVAGIGVGKTKV